jgi:hypothetical protein
VTSGQGRDTHVHAPLVEDRWHFFEHWQLIPHDPPRINSVVQARNRRTDKPDHRATLLAGRQKRLPVPGGNEIKRLLSGMEQPLSLHVRLEIGNVNKSRTTLVRRSSNCTHTPLTANRSAHQHNLPRLDIRAKLDQQTRIPAQRPRVDTPVSADGARVASGGIPLAGAGQVQRSHPSLC